MLNWTVVALDFSSQTHEQHHNWKQAVSIIAFVLQLTLKPNTGFGNDTVGALLFPEVPQVLNGGLRVTVAKWQCLCMEAKLVVFGL